MSWEAGWTEWYFLEILGFEHLRGWPSWQGATASVIRPPGRPEGLNLQFLIWFLGVSTMQLVANREVFDGR